MANRHGEIYPSSVYPSYSRILQLYYPFHNFLGRAHHPFMQTHLKLLSYNRHIWNLYKRSLLKSSLGFAYLKLFNCKILTFRNKLYSQRRKSPCPTAPHTYINTWHLLGNFIIWFNLLIYIPARYPRTCPNLWPYFHSLSSGESWHMYHNTCLKLFCICKWESCVYGHGSCACEDEWSLDEVDLLRLGI